MTNAQKKGGRHSPRRRDAIAAAFIAACAVASLVAWRLWQGGVEDGVARVTDGDGTVYELPLSEDAELVVTTELGTNVIEVADGRVRVRDADCPNQNCVDQGWISAQGEQIVCLPHRLYVEVVSGADSGIDLMGG